MLFVIKTTSAIGLCQKIGCKKYNCLRFQELLIEVTIKRVKMHNLI